MMFLVQKKNIIFLTLIIVFVGVIVIFFSLENVRKIFAVHVSTNHEEAFQNNDVNIIGNGNTEANEENVFGAIAGFIDDIKSNSNSNLPKDIVPSDDSKEHDGMIEVKDINNDEKQTQFFVPHLILKDVGEPYLNRFGLAPSDFKRIKNAGFDTIEGNFDICANPSDVVTFLDSAHDAELKVILSAGAGEAEWGYPCNDDYSPNQKPVWQKEKVQAWVKTWSYHPALYAWDISNEDGQNFPNAQSDDTTWIERGHAVSLAQLQHAYRDVKTVDPHHPIMIRMNGWFFYDYDSNFFRNGNAFGSGVADVVMVNAYSNLIDEYFPDLTEKISSRAVNSIHAIDPTIPIYISLGAWGEEPMWAKPSIAHLIHDREKALNVVGISGIAIFKYGAEEGDWWMPRDAEELWKTITTW